MLCDPLTETAEALLVDGLDSGLKGGCHQVTLRPKVVVDCGEVDTGFCSDFSQGHRSITFFGENFLGRPSDLGAGSRSFRGRIGLGHDSNGCLNPALCQ